MYCLSVFHHACLPPRTHQELAIVSRVHVLIFHLGETTAVLLAPFFTMYMFLDFLPKTNSLKTAHSDFYTEGTLKQFKEVLVG